MAFNKHRDISGEDGRVFVLENIPLNYKEDMIIDYVEGTLDVDVEKVKLYSFLQGRALVYLVNKLTDFSKAKEKIAKASLESKKVKLLKTSRDAALVVNSIDFQKLSEEFLCLYFESEFADGFDIIESSSAWPELNMALVNFHPLHNAVVEKILESSDLVPLPSEDYHISVHACYKKFHEYIGQQIHEDIANLGEEKEMEEDAEDKMEEDGEDDDDDVSEEETDEDTDESDTKEVKNVSKHSDDDDDSESESTQESDSDREHGNVGSASSQVLNRNQNKNTNVRSDQRASTVRGGFRGRGGKAMRGGLMTSSRKNSYEENNRKDYVGSKSSLSRNASHERNDSRSQGERQTGKMAHAKGRGKSYDRFELPSLSIPPHDDDVEMKSEVSQITIKKAHNFRGRGGAVFRVSEQSQNFLTRELPACNTRFNESENHGRWNVDAPIFKPDMSEQHSTSSSISARKTLQDETLGASYSPNLPANKMFQKVEEESKKKLESEIALKNAQIKQLEEKLAKKDEQPKQCSEKIEMSTWQKEFLPHCFGHFEDCHISFDGNFAIIEGKSESVQKQQLKLLKELTKLKEKPLEITPAMHSILCKERGKQYLQSCVNTNDLGGAKAFLHETHLLVVAKSDEDLQKTLGFLNGKLNYKETCATDAEIPTEKLHFLKFSLEKKNLVKISWNDKETEISIEGIKDDVFESVREIKTLMLEHTDLEKSFAVKGLHAKLFHKFYEDKIKHYLHAVKIVEYSSTEADIAIKFKGDRKAIQQVHRNLTELQTKVMTKSWDLRSEFKKPEDLMLIVKGFASAKMKKKIETLEATKKCIVLHKLPSLESFNVGTSKKKPQALHSTLKHKEQKQFFAPVKTENKLKLDINGTCQLVVKPYGDITKETSDVLVNLLTTHIDLRRTRVGQSFNKACPSLWKTLQTEQATHPTDVVLTTKGPFKYPKCQAICHIVLTEWDPNSSPALLSTAIQSVITQAVSLGAKSISFPVLGCGRAFKFPPSDVAEITFASIKSSQAIQALQKVVLLAPDVELFKEFKSKVSTHFSLSPAKYAPVQVVGATSSTTEKDEEDVSEESEDETSDGEDEESVIEVLHDSQSSGNAEISITVLHGNSSTESIWSDLKSSISKVCLHKQYVNQDIVNVWPKDSRVRILQEAKESCVWVELSKDPKTNKPGYIVKGEKKQVEHVAKTIKAELEKFSSHLPKNRIKSSKAPKRGTCEFLKHAADSDELFPSYWKRNSLNPEKGFFQTLTDVFKPHKPPKDCVSVDSATKEAIIDLINKTWDPSKVGAGNDAAGLSHSKIKVIDVKRIENLTLFESYSTYRKMLFRKMCLKKKICPDIGKIPGSKGRVMTTDCIKNFMKEELYYEVNEHFLFHGTKAPKAIISNGIDPRVSSEGGMFGKGIYTAEAFTKSDQYTDSRGQRSPPGTTLYMVLARVLLGNVFLCDHTHPSVASKQSTKLTRPPCIQCSNDKCNCPNQELYNSVMGDGKWIFREFVVYDQNQCYPEYLISYQRG